MKHLLIICCLLQLSTGKKEIYLGQKSALTVADTLRKTGLGDLTGPWQLLVDDYLVDKKENIQRTYHSFIKHPRNPLLGADKPWEGKITYVYGSVLPNEQQNGYRLWYHSWWGEYANLYATSKDGLTWSKPNLNIIDYKGSKANNIFFRRTKEDHLPQVIHTPWEKDPARRYKLINYDYGRTKPDHMVSGFWGAYSADGIHWKDVARNPVLKDPGDVGNFVWDSHTGGYIGYPKVFAPVRGFNRRSVGFTATKDFENWPSAQLILVPDKEDDHWETLPDQRTEFYGLSGFPYESGYLGFLWIFHITDGKNDGPIYCELVSSRDGIKWVRQEPSGGKRLPILPVGPKGSWDQGMVFSTNHPLVEGNMIKLWYGGSEVTHDAHDDSAKSGIGLATIRKDGFASLDAKDRTGIVTTKLLKNLHGELLLNADAHNGSIKVELLSTDGKPVGGFTYNDCSVIQGDDSRLRVTWKNNNFLPDKQGQYRLRFTLQNASLYSFMGGKDVDLAEPEKPQLLYLSFDDLDKLSPVSKSQNPYTIYGDLSVIYDKAKAARGTGTAKFSPGNRNEENRMELTNTADLGPQFTLSAMIKTPGKKLTRLFSNYRGGGELVTGELLFDFDPSGSEINGLRFNVNGQTVVSKVLKFDDGRYHQLAVTYNRGKVLLYVDGQEVGSGQLELGAAHLYSDKSVRRYFDQPNALPEVGIYLGGNLNIGDDIGGRFVTYKDEVIAPPIAQLTGFVDEVLVIRKALSAIEINQIYKNGIRSIKP